MRTVGTVGLIALAVFVYGGQWYVGQRRAAGRTSRPGGRRDVDRRARLLVSDRQGLRRYTDAKAGPAHLRQLGLGPVVGQVIGGPRKQLHLTFEDVMVMIAGARTGKSSTQVIPSILSAVGPVYTTSNKGDVVAATRAARETVGPIWLYDPQGLACTTDPTMWWDPLDLAHDLPGARNLAGLLAGASRPPDSSMDSYFDVEGEELLALLLFAAAVAGRPITQVYRWLTPLQGRPVDEPADILAAADHDLAAGGILAVIGQPDKQRAGVYGTAKKMTAWLADEAIAAWAVPPGDGTPRFDCETFLDAPATLYSLSKEGPGSAAPLTAALTAAVLQAAERKAAASPGGRLPVPLTCALDEVANCARIRQLPDSASHYGSRSIVLMAYLQSWSQGVECWGREGMAKLWGSANVRVYGGGVNERDFLEAISTMCGTWAAPHATAGPGGVSESTRTEPIFDVSTLAALPAVGRRRSGRALVMLSGTRPVVVATRRPRVRTR